MLGDAARKEADDAVVNAMILFLNAKITKLYQMAIYSSIFGSFFHDNITSQFNEVSTLSAVLRSCLAENQVN